jgi:hypothetical protein
LDSDMKTLARQIERELQFGAGHSQPGEPETAESPLWQKFF